MARIFKRVCVGVGGSYEVVRIGQGICLGGWAIRVFFKN